MTDMVTEVAATLPFLGQNFIKNIPKKLGASISLFLGTQS